MPFAKMTDESLPVPVLAQIGKKRFEICVPFRYRRRIDEPWITVPDGPANKVTDLASVPGFLLWFVPRYGAHTLAALLHDQLVKVPDQRVLADTIFRDALGELKVPWIRRWFMWAAVSLATTVNSGWLGKLRIAAWGLLVGGASLTFWQQTFAGIGDWEHWSWWIFGNGRWWDLLIVALAALALFPRVGLGLVAGAAVVFVFVATAFVLVTLVAYVALELVARGGLWLYAKAPWVGDVATNPAVMSIQTDANRPLQTACPPLAPDPDPPPIAPPQR